MAESQSPAPGLIGSTTFAIYWSASLFKVIHNVKPRQKQARDLEKELEALQEILQGFRESIGAHPENSLDYLDFPLVQCGNACKNFEENIERSSKLSEVTTLDFRDWAHLKYMGEGIDAFRRLLANYKASIIVALANADGKTIIPGDGREHYKDLAENAVVDIEAHLESIDRRLNDLDTENPTESEIHTEEIQLTMAVRMSLETCLQVCIHFSSRIDDTPHNAKDKKTSSGCLPGQANHVGLREDIKSLLDAGTKLESHMKALMDRVLSNFREADTSRQDIEDMVRLQEEWETIRKCIHICIRAENDPNDNISTIHNHAAGDAIQFIVSTNGNTIKGENRATGWRTRQVGGHISDTSLQQLAKHMARINVSEVDDEKLSHTDEENQHTSGFEENYGRGFRMTTEKSVSNGGFCTSSARSGPRHTPEP